MSKVSNVKKTPSSRKTRKLSFWKILTMGFKGIGHHPARLIFSILFAVISFVSVGLSMVNATSDKTGVELNAAYQAGVHTIELNCCSTTKMKRINGDEMIPSFNEFTLRSILGRQEQQTKIEKYMAFMPVFEPSKTYFDDDGYLGKDWTEWSSAESNPYNWYGYSLVKTLVELDPTTGEKDAVLTPDRRLTKECRLPKDFTEIAITDYIADMFMRFGYCDKNGDKRVYDINSPDDLIGKDLGGLTIVGVYETDNEKNWLKEYYSDVYEEDDYINSWMQGVHSMRYGFVCRGFQEEKIGNDGFTRVLYRLSGDMEKDKEILKSFEHEVEREDYYENVNAHVYETCLYFFEVRTGVSSFADKVAVENQSFAIRLIFAISVYTNIALVVISLLLRIIFLMKGVKEPSEEFESLIETGASKSDIGSICFMQSIVIAVIDFVLSWTVLELICFALNSYARLPLFAVGILPLIGLFVLSFGSAMLAALLPSRKAKHLAD